MLSGLVREGGRTLLGTGMLRWRQPMALCKLSVMTRRSHSTEADVEIELSGLLSENARSAARFCISHDFCRFVLPRASVYVCTGTKVLEFTKVAEPNLCQGMS